MQLRIIIFIYAPQIAVQTNPSYIAPTRDIPPDVMKANELEGRLAATLGVGASAGIKFARSHGNRVEGGSESASIPLLVASPGRRRIREPRD